VKELGQVILIRPFGNEGAPSLLGGDYPFSIQFQIGPGHRIRVDAQIGCQLAYCRELFARLKLPGRHEMFNAVHDLQIDRLRTLHVQPDFHLASFYPNPQIVLIKLIQLYHYLSSLSRSVSVHSEFC